MKCPSGLSSSNSASTTWYASNGPRLPCRAQTFAPEPSLWSPLDMSVHFYLPPAPGLKATPACQGGTGEEPPPPYHETIPGYDSPKAIRLTSLAGSYPAGQDCAGWCRSSRQSQRCSPPTRGSSSLSGGRTYKTLLTPSPKLFAVRHRLPYLLRLSPFGPLTVELFTSAGSPPPFGERFRR